MVETREPIVDGLGVCARALAAGGILRSEEKRSHVRRVALTDSSFYPRSINVTDDLYVEMGNADICRAISTEINDMSSLALTLRTCRTATQPGQISCGMKFSFSSSMMKHNCANGNVLSDPRTDRWTETYCLKTTTTTTTTRRALSAAESNVNRMFSLIMEKQ